MPVEGWRHDTANQYGRTYNPGKVNIRVKEFGHEPLSMIKDLRGGPRTSDHVDILGNHELTMDILKICGAREHEVEDRILSNIEQLAAQVRLE